MDKRPTLVALVHERDTCRKAWQRQDRNGDDIIVLPGVYRAGQGYECSGAVLSLYSTAPQNMHIAAAGGDQKGSGRQGGRGCGSIGDRG